MKEKQFYTTGETSQMLGISRATISRKFDSGILLGKRNPITGERLVSHESIMSFMRKYNLMMPLIIEEEERERSEESAGKKAVDIVVGSPNKKVFDALSKTLKSMGPFNTEYFDNGYDAVIHCSGSLPDILILDEKLRHVSFKDIIRSLRQLDAHNKLKIIMMLKTNDPVKIDDWGADSYLYWDVLACQAPTRQHEHIAYKIGGLLEDDDLIDRYREKTIASVCLSRYQNIIEWVEAVSPSLLDELHSAVATLPEDHGIDGESATGMGTVIENSKMVQYMLSPLRMFSEKYSPAMKQIDLHELVARCVSLFERTTTAKFHFRQAKSPWAVEGDEDLLAAMVLQVLMNADQASSGSGEIDITLKRLAGANTKKLPLDEREYVQITVLDNGTGISKTYSERIFDPLFTTKPGCSGEGLTSVQSVLELHKGLIDIKSTPGEYTKVNIYLPVKQ